jgi:nucleotide-binding universal stress UspA family protein
LLVVGGSGHSALYGRLIGSRADRIVHLAPCPVLVVAAAAGSRCKADIP